MARRRKKTELEACGEPQSTNMAINRRSVVIVDECLFGPRLLDELSKVESFSDENILRSVARTCEGEVPNAIEALSLEVGPHSLDKFDFSNVTLRRSFCVTDIVNACLEMDDSIESVLIVKEILDDIIEIAVNKSVHCQAVTNYTHFYHPLAGREDIEKMSFSFNSTLSVLGDQTARLQEAYRIILVQAAKQIVVSYRRILMKHTLRLQMGDQESQLVAAETGEALLNVTRTVAELTVEYLKEATRSVVDSSVAEIRLVLGRMNEKREIELVEEDKEIEFVDKKNKDL